MPATVRVYRLSVSDFRRFLRHEAAKWLDPAPFYPED